MDSHNLQPYYYQRIANPNRSILEKCIADIEHAKYCTIVSTGIASGAIVSLMLQPGNRIIANPDMYMGYYAFFNKSMQPH